MHPKTARRPACEANLPRRRWWSLTALALLLLALAAPSAAFAQPASPADAELRGHGGPVRAIAILGAGTGLLSGSFDSAAIVWDVASGSARRVLRHHDSTVNAVAELPGGCLATGGEDARIAIWCGADREPRHLLKGHAGPVSALAVSPDGTRLASASWDRTVRIWPLAEPQAPPRVIEGHQGPVNGLAFTRDGTALLSAGYDGQLRLTPFAPGRQPLVDQQATPYAAVAVAPDDSLVTVGADGRVRLWSPALEPSGDVELSAGPLTALALSPDGHTIATAGLRTPVTLIDRATLKPRAEILGPGLPVWAVAFSADGRTLYSGGIDRAIRRWDPATGKPAGADLAAAVEPERQAAANDRGAQVFRACRACHSLKPGESLAGPTLAGIFGRRIATAPGYAYSDALTRLDIVWTPQTVSRLFEIGPTAMTPGTKMPEQRITDPADRQALIDWLKKAGG